MASMSTDAKGNRRVLFMAADGQRRQVRLGRVPKKTANTIKVRIESLAAAQLARHAPDPETSAWLGDIEAVLYDKLAAVGLVPQREAKRKAEAVALGPFIDDYIAARPTMKPNTIKNYKATRRALVGFFGEDRALTDISPGDCDDWHADQVAKGLAPATIGRTVKRAKQFFRAAVRKNLIAENPMQDVKAAQQVNKAREQFVTQEVIEKVITACPDAEWRLIVALARYGGLRTPSETFKLTWGDVDWEAGRMRVPSPKTACHAGRESRMIPLFPELRPHLEAVFDEAEPGTTFVINRHRLGSANLRTQLERIIRRAGVNQWPRLFQNLRASRETELCQDHPLHVVTTWIGNTAAVAARHYLQVTDADFERGAKGGAQSGAQSGVQAAQNAAQPTPAKSRRSCQERQKALADKGLWPSVANDGVPGQMSILPPRGVEPLSSD